MITIHCRPDDAVANKWYWTVCGDSHHPQSE